MRKLKSNKGLSITVALLLFLVCAVIGSVVLAAGTAAAGRLSRLAERDARYYSVSSATELLINEFTGEARKVTITRTGVTTDRETTHFTYSAGAFIQGSTSSSPTEKKYNTNFNGFAVYPANGFDGSMSFSATGSLVDTGSFSFLTGRAAKLMFGGSQCNTEAAMGYSFTEGNQESGSFTVSHADSDLDVDCTYVLKADGTLEITIKSGDYSQTLILTPVISQTASEHTSVSTSIDRTGMDYDEVKTTEVTVTKTAVIYWIVGGIG